MPRRMTSIGPRMFLVIFLMALLFFLMRFSFSNRAVNIKNLSVRYNLFVSRMDPETGSMFTNRGNSESLTIRPVQAASPMNSTAAFSNATSSSPSEKMRWCAEVRRRVSWGVVDYVRRDGDPELLELVQPMFTRKKLVVWSVDHHVGPISDIRGLIEPLGVEFIEHTIYSNCELMCTCDQLKGFPLFNERTIIFLGRDIIDRFYRETRGDRDISRADAFLVAYSIPIIELYERYNRSIIAVDAIRYERTLWNDINRWRELNDRLRALISDRRHVIGANSLYDVEYIYYFVGARPDYVPSFCAYTGNVSYNPTRDLLLYAHRPNRKIGTYWTQPFERRYRQVNASFRIEQLKKAYKTYDLSQLASHPAIIHLPYQVIFLRVIPEIVL